MLGCYRSLRTDARVKELGGPLNPLGNFGKSPDPHPTASAPVTVRPGADGCVNLIGGGLRGWAGDAKYWFVKKGVLTGITDGTLKANSFLTWKGSTIRNFDLRVKVRVTPGGNSGIQYRSRMRPDLGLYAASGYQCDVVTKNPNYNGMLYEEKGRRILAHTGEKVTVDEQGRSWITGKMPAKEFAAGEWHEYRVLVRGNHHQHWIDGPPTADLSDSDDSNNTWAESEEQVARGIFMELQRRRSDA